jgi:curved DNA-binding protein CbpA
MANFPPPDPYKALGLTDRAVELTEIKRVYRKLVLQCHPDKVQDPALKASKQEEFSRIQQAYEILSDDVRRRRYDEQFRQREEWAKTAIGSDYLSRWGPSAWGREAEPAREPPRSRRSPVGSDGKAGRRYPSAESPPEKRTHPAAQPDAFSHTSRPRSPMVRRARGLADSSESEEDRLSDRTRRDRDREMEAARRRRARDDGKAFAAAAERRRLRRQERAEEPAGGGRAQKLYQAFVADDDDDDDNDDVDDNGDGDYYDGEHVRRKRSGARRRRANLSGSGDPVSRMEVEIEERNDRAYANMYGKASAGRASEAVPSTAGPAEQEPPKPRLPSVPVSQLGFEVMAAGTDVSVDIVAVHGLGAIPEITWRHSASGVTWLSDPGMLPKEVPEARILRFGYDSVWLGKEPINTRLDTIARKLLLALNRERGVRRVVCRFGL